MSMKEQKMNSLINNQKYPMVTRLWSMVATLPKDNSQGQKVTRHMSEQDRRLNSPWLDGQLANRAPTSFPNVYILVLFSVMSAFLLIVRVREQI